MLPPTLRAAAPNPSAPAVACRPASRPKPEPETPARSSRTYFPPTPIAMPGLIARAKLTPKALLDTPKLPVAWFEASRPANPPSPWYRAVRPQRFAPFPARPPNEIHSCCCDSSRFACVSATCVSDIHARAAGFQPAAFRPSREPSVAPPMASAAGPVPVARKLAPVVPAPSMLAKATPPEASRPSAISRMRFMWALLRSPPRQTSRFRAPLPADPCRLHGCRTSLDTCVEPPTRTVAR